MTRAASVPAADEVVEVALDAAREAARLVVGIARGGAASMQVAYKVGDDPVTRADREANELLRARLARAFPGVPIVAEESSAPEPGAREARAVFFVDPIDGTRDYVAGREGYAVMIGLAVDGEARVGVLVLPAAHEAFVGIVGEGAHRVLPDGTRAPVTVSRLEDPSRARVLVSRSRRGPDVDEALARLGAADVRSMGSVGVKAARVAEGTADLYFYPGGRLAHWDTCGPEAVVRAAGGAFTGIDGTPIDYRAADGLGPVGTLVANVALHATVRARLA